MTSLTNSEYRDLIEAAVPDLTDADTILPNQRTLFTPRSHKDALLPDKTIVEGARGVGKTFWCRSLLDPQLRATAATEFRLPKLRDLKVSPGFGAELRPGSYPGPRELAALAERHAPQDIWYAVVVNALGIDELQARPSWEEKLHWVRDEPDVVERAVAAANRALRADGTSHLVVFDALDRLHRDRQVAERLIGGIFEVATALRLGASQIRIKVFIRPDMFREGLLRFTDASKIAGSTNLRWNPTDLYGLVFHYLGNAEADDVLSERFRGRLPGWQRSDVNVSRWVVPARLSNDVEVQQHEFTAMAGEFMGTNFRKGRTYSWLPNHLMDGSEQVTPRSFLSACRTAVRVTRSDYEGHPFAIHHEGLRRGVQEASMIRVREINEDIPWVKTLAAPLEGVQVPIDESAVVTAWRDADVENQLAALHSPDENSPLMGPRDPEDLDGLVEQLIDLGVLRRRKDRRLDMPDVYRVAFRIGRKGGVPRISQPN